MKRIETSTEIAAPPDRVWKELTDFGALHRWNPLIRSVKGRLRPGARLKVRIATPNDRDMVLRPRVLAVEPERELRWKERLWLPFLFDGERWFRLERTDRNTTRFHHGERLSGILAALMGESGAGTLRKGLQGMNNALKHRAEARRA